MTRRTARFLVRLRRLRRRIIQLTPLRLWLFAVLVGAASAYGVIGFRIAIDAVSVIAFGETEKTMVSAARNLDFFRTWMAPVLGGVAVSGILYLADQFKWLEGGRGQGVADVIEARAVGDGRISLRAGLAAATVSAVSLGSGASAGREGPAVHLGATIASFLDRRFSFTARDRRTLLGCGAAAAVAASFNAPIAGVLFALEVVMGSYALSVFGPIAAGSVAAAIVTRAHMGDFPAFVAPVHDATAAIDAPLAALLGLVCGLVASVFLIITERMTERVRALADARGVSYLALPPFAGMVLGLVGAFYPEIFSVGYETVTNIFTNAYGLGFLLLILFLKIGATALTLSCRFGGGVFSPSLVIGALTGASFGAMIGALGFNGAAAPPFYAMIGMGALAGAVMGAPISTTLIIFEMTGDYAMTISLMVAVALATLVTQSLAGQSFFHWQLSRRGYDISEGPQGVILKTIRVREVMERSAEPGEIAKEARRLNADQTLGEAIAVLDGIEELGLPVVESAQSTVSIGYLSRLKALRAYNRALIQSHIDQNK